MIKTGAQLMRQWANVFYAGNNGRSGFINFNGQFTQGPNGNPRLQKRFQKPDFVLGLPNDLGRGLSSGTWGQRKTIYGLYVQDDWRVTDTLTLNLGLRWEYHTPLVEVEDRQSNFGLFSGQLELAGQDGNSRALYNPYRKDFQPRLGFAWTPSMTSKKLVVRGAYTISSFMEGTGTNLRLPLNPPFEAEFETVYQSSLGNLPLTNLDQGLSGLNPKDPYIGANIRLWDPNVRPSEVQQWNLTLEYQLPSNNVLSVGYVGQHGTHLIAAMPFFQKQLVNGQVLPSPYLAGNPTLVSKITQISGTQSGANQKYNGMQVSLHKRFSAGIEYQVSYTWSRAMSDSIGYYGDGGQSGSQSAYMQNLYDRRAEWSPAYFDLKHNFVASYFYEMPFGKAKRFGSNWNPVVNGVLGGWQMGGSFQRAYRLPADHQDHRPLRHSGPKRAGKCDWHTQRFAYCRSRQPLARLGRLWAARGVHLRKLGSRSGPWPGRGDLQPFALEALPGQRAAMVRASRRGVQPVQHADLQQSDLANHHIGCVRRSVEHTGRAQCASRCEVLLLMRGDRARTVLA